MALAAGNKEPSSRREGLGVAMSWVMVGARGFEPPTSSSRTMRAAKLRHAPTEVPVEQGTEMIAPEGRLLSGG